MDAIAFDVSTAAKMSGLSEHTLRQYIRKGWLNATRCGRRVLIPADSLKKLVREGAPSRSGQRDGRSSEVCG
jgi:excisionase family DNA binding protein